MIAGEVVYGTESPVFSGILELRRSCWQYALPAFELLDDGHDNHAFHFIMKTQGRVIAAARLCKHGQLVELPDPHLFRPWTNPLNGPYGCCSRLVVDPEYRNIGIASLLDQVRADAATKLGCSALVIIWNEHSGIPRRNAIEAQGFLSASNGMAVADGEWGRSYPYARSIDGDICSFAGDQANHDILPALSRSLDQRTQMIQPSLHRIGNL